MTKLSCLQGAGQGAPLRGICPNTAGMMRTTRQAMKAFIFPNLLLESLEDKGQLCSIMKSCWLLYSLKGLTSGVAFLIPVTGSINYRY